MSDNYEGRPSRKKLSFIDYIIILLIICAIGYGGYRYGPHIVFKFKQALGYYDEEDQSPPTLAG